MWPGPYGDLGSRKYLLASLDESLSPPGDQLRRHFYHHRFDPDTPLKETIGTLDTAVRQGKTLYIGISSYSDLRTREAVAILQSSILLLVHQPSYSMFNRGGSRRNSSTYSASEGVGCIGFSPLAQGLLTERYLDRTSRRGRAASEDSSLSRDMLSEENLAPGAGPGEDRGQAGPEASPSWRWPGPCATRASPRSSSGPAASPSWRRTWRRSTTSTSPTRS